MFTQRIVHRIHVLGCLLLVYLSWGSSFIAIKFAIESFPPFLMCGIRMSMAGVLLYALTWLRGERVSPSWRDVRQDFILAFFMVFVSSALLSKGQESVASGTAALMLGSIPIWMVVSGWLVCHEAKPTLIQWVGLVIGFSGLILLSLHQGLSGGDASAGLLLVLLAALGWVVGSIYSKRIKGQTGLSVFRGSAVLMFIGGLQSLVAALVLGEWSEFSGREVSGQSLFALGYLVVAGGVIAYSCYFWLLMSTRTAVAISYEYVNPVIGVFLGWVLAGESVDGIKIIACTLTVCSVFFVVGRSGGHSTETAPTHARDAGIGQDMPVQVSADASSMLDVAASASAFAVACATDPGPSASPDC